MSESAPSAGQRTQSPSSLIPAAHEIAPNDVWQVTVGTLVRVLSWIRSALGWLSVGYFVALTVTLLSLEWWGERIWLLGVILYAPPQIFLLPLFVLTPVTLLFRWRMVGWHLAAVAMVFFGFMTFRWSHPPSPRDDSVTIVTFNAGESNGPQFAGFLEHEKPDLVFLQDVGGRAPAVAAKVPGASLATIGQFSFISKTPLSKPAVVEAGKTGGQVVAARCETVIAGRSTALYSVHLPTPRQQLGRFLGGRRVLGDLMGRPHREPGFGNYREWLAARIAMSQGLARVFDEERLPMIVAGDFNTPDHGYIYHLFAGKLTDSHLRGGRGWGLTFPGVSRHSIAFYGPWLRLDYIFTGPGWKVTECRPEPGNKSQHKAVLARLEPLSSH